MELTPLQNPEVREPFRTSATELHFQHNAYTKAQAP